MNLPGYILVVTTPSYPNGVKYPERGCSHYSREKAIEHMRRFVSRGHTSDYKSRYGVYAEGEGERFTLADIDGTAD
jgi:hypothetical protein